MPKFLANKDVKQLIALSTSIISVLLGIILSLCLYIRAGDIKRIETIETNVNTLVKSVASISGRLQIPSQPNSIKE